MEAKIQKLKGKLENLKHVSQINLELQQELINVKEKKTKKVSSSLNRLAARIASKRSENGVSIVNRYTLFFYLHVYSCAM